MPTVKLHLFLRMEKKKNEYKYSEILHKWNETVHFGSYSNTPETRWAVDQVDVHSLCALVLYLLSHCSLVWISGLICKLPITPCLYRLAYSMWSPKSCVIFIRGDIVTNMTMCKSSDLLKYFRNQTTLN